MRRHRLLSIPESLATITALDVEIERVERLARLNAATLASTTLSISTRPLIDDVQTKHRERLELLRAARHKIEEQPIIATAEAGVSS